jgi:hypothetical protein
VVGGLVPELLREFFGDEAEEPSKTADVDLGFDIAIANGDNYLTVRDTLLRSGFNREHLPDLPYRWTYHDPTGILVYIDFLIPYAPLEAFGAFYPTSSFFLTEGLNLAFVDRVRRHLHGVLPDGNTGEAAVWVCGPGAFIILKALAFESRRLRGDAESLQKSQKDASDLYYVLSNYDKGPRAIANLIKTFGSDPAVLKARNILLEHFSDSGSLGPRSVSLFREGGLDRYTQVAVTSAFLDLFKYLGWQSS